MQRVVGQMERWNLRLSVANPLHLVCNTYVNAVRALCGWTAIQLGYKHLFGSPNAPLATAASLTVVV
jgi:hypothetical protein